MAKRIIDISVCISPDMPICPGDPIPSFKGSSSIVHDGFAVSKISMGTHTGTHIDAPSHIIEGGASINTIALDNFYGKALVLDLGDLNRVISGNVVESHLERVAAHEKEKAAILLLKTSCSESLSMDSETQRSNIFFDGTLGQWFVNSGFKTVGIDMLSIDPEYDHALPNHHLLLKNNICIIENLDLNGVEEGIYEFVCLPLKLVGCDASPARAILIEEY